MGGMLCGLACSFIFLPDIAEARLRRLVPVLSASCLSFFLLLLPIVVYSRREVFASCALVA